VASTRSLGDQLRRSIEHDQLTRRREGIVVQRWKVFLDTDDAAGLYERAVAAGAESVLAPKLLERFNVTIAMFRDPDGYLLEVGQRPLTPEHRSALGQPHWMLLSRGQAVDPGRQVDVTRSGRRRVA
jgi:hypothetical protein